MTTRGWIVLALAVVLAGGCDGWQDNTGPSVLCEEAQGDSAIGVRCGNKIGPSVPAIPE